MTPHIPDHLCSVGALNRRRRFKYAEKYNLRQMRSKLVFRFLTPRFLDQLDACKSEAARRILLGVSR